jgi:hypothetical protein
VLKKILLDTKFPLELRFKIMNQQCQLGSESSLSPRVKTVVLVLAEASRQRAQQLGGAVVRVNKPSALSKCGRCQQLLYVGQRVVMTTWRPVYLRQVHWAGGSGPVPIYECGACSLEKILSRRPAVSTEIEEPEQSRKEESGAGQAC